MSRVEPLPAHILDADVTKVDGGTWFAHSHEHTHGGVAGEELLEHAHRHDHRRRSKRGDWDHHPIDRPRAGTRVSHGTVPDRGR